MVPDVPCATEPRSRSQVKLFAAAVLRGIPRLPVTERDRISDFMAVHRIAEEPEGTPFSRFRRVPVSRENDTLLEVIERRGYRGYLPERPDPSRVQALLQAHELWKRRPRIFDEDAEGFRRTHALLDRVIGLLGPDLACHVVFAEERAYWESRNRAARIQKRRRDSLGLGWANHDHHTFRCSRIHFVDFPFLKQAFTERRTMAGPPPTGNGPSGCCASDSLMRNSSASL